MKIKGWDLDFFNSGEWQVCDERLQDIQTANKPIREGFNPGRAGLFRSLRLIPFSEVRVCFIGQDPYPDAKYATGVALSIPEVYRPSEWPASLRIFLGEYTRDLHYELPSSGNLERWCQNGVLLWNAYPSCRSGASLSHDWPEWETLTNEIVSKLAAKGIVFVCLGKVAHRCVKSVSDTNNRVVYTSHPSPLGARTSHNPFIGSRVFTTVNAYMNELALQPVDWKLT